MMVTLIKVFLSVFPLGSWPLRRGGEDQEGCREASGGRDSAGIPARLSWGGVRWQPPVPRPWRLPAQVRQLVFTLALQECLLQSLLHQISLDTDAGGAKECVCVHVSVCVYACLCLGTRKWRPSCSRPKPPEGDKDIWKLSSEFGRQTTLYWMCVKMQEPVDERPPQPSSTPIPTTPPWKRNVFYCCVSTNWPGCAHLDTKL